MRRHQVDGAATWHVMSRAVGRLDLFRDDADYEGFIERLEAACEKSEVVPLAYALMPNHYHLLASGTSPALSAAMHRLNRSYARAYNTRHGQRGHVFEGAYRSFAMSTEWRIVHSSRYIHLNPVAAKLAKRPADWKWSSYGAYAGGRVEVRGLRSSGVLQIAGGREEYAKGMQEMMETLPRKNPANSPEGLWEAEARWVQAQVAAAPPEGIDAKALALVIAREAGVPPRVSAGVFGFSSPLYAGIVASRWDDRMERDAKFAEAVKAWRRRAGI